MSKASEIVAIAKSQIGYKEKASNKNLDDNTANAGSANWTKYARDLAAAGYYNGNKNGYAWCDVFVDWCFFKAYGATEGQRIQCQTGDCGAGCTYSMQYYKAQGRLDMNPKVGDQLFFRYSGSSGADHTGIVVEVTASQIITVEGNSGDRVKQNTYSRSYGCIVGYGHPKYDDPVAENTTPVTEPAVTEPTADTAIKVGSKVEIKASAEKYNPTSTTIPGWVKSDYYHIVTQTTVNGKAVVKGGKTCVLLGKKVRKNGGSEASGINTWVSVDNLTVVGEAAETAADDTSDEIIHTVVKGDTLWKIALKYLGKGSRYPEIKRLNNLSGDTIFVGQKLKIPNK